MKLVSPTLQSKNIKRQQLITVLLTKGNWNLEKYLITFKVKPAKSLITLADIYYSMQYRYYDKCLEFIVTIV